jgi:hypothetical protein
MNPLCECTGAGFCERHQMNKSETLYSMCKGTANCADCGRKYWTAWEKGLVGATAPANPVVNPPEFCSPDGQSPGHVACGGCSRPPSVAKPSILQYATNASQALARFVGDGLKTVSDEEQSERMAVCDTCPLNQNGQCVGCGCVIKYKTAARLEKCPAGKWFPSVRDKRALIDPVRNLIMHILPVAWNNNWKWNMDEVLKRVDLFNGKKVLAIAIETRDNVAGKNLKTVSADDVIDYCNCIGLKWDRIEAFPNNSFLREVATFPYLLESVESINPNEVTFSCHGKSTTHREDSITVKWAERQYKVCLDNWEYTQSALERYSIAGSFRRFGEFTTPGNNRWHYSGTFYWFRHDDVFSSSKWRNIDKQFFGTESWPGMMFKPEESACLFADNVGDMYNQPAWNALQNEIKIWDEARIK